MLSRFEHPALLPAFPRRILATSTITKINYNGVPNSYNFSTIEFLSNQKITNSLFQISLPLQRSLENIEKEWSSCVSEERKSNSESISRTLLKMNEKYQHKTRNKLFWNIPNFWIFSWIIVVNVMKKFSPNTPIYRRGLGFRFRN